MATCRALTFSRHGMHDRVELSRIRPQLLEFFFTDVEAAVTASMISGRIFEYDFVRAPLSVPGRSPDVVSVAWGSACVLSKDQLHMTCPG